MHHVILMAIAGSLAVPGAAEVAARSGAAIEEHEGRFTANDFARLRFLEGRWSGKAPDGSIFYEEYDLTDKVTMRSRRYADGAFTTPTDGSTVVLRDGKVISTWGKFTWEAASLAEGMATFRPLNAPSSFTWRRLRANAVEVTQRWTDDKGAPQTYSLTLDRIR